MSLSSFRWTDLFAGRSRTCTQLVFWLIVYCLYIVLKEYPASFTGVSLVCIVLQETLELVVPSYTQNLLILPLFRRHFWVAGIAAYLLQVILLVSFLPYLLNAVSILFASTGRLAERVDWRQEHIGFSIIAFTLVATAVRLALDRLMQEQEQRETELRQLKEQINPHFLFNTLNNLYGLAVIRSEKLPALMLKLSDLLRYSLYETGHHYVPLSKEISYINDYIELETIRLEEKTIIGFSVEGEMNGQSVSPLILISFVENAFKHFSVSRDKQAGINISINMRDSDLTMIVQNSLDPALYLQQSEAKRDAGIGMSNARGRLRLLYPERHHLTVEHTPEFFKVELKLDLRR